MPLWQFLHGLSLDFDVFHFLIWNFVAQDADPRLVVLLQRRVEGQRDLLRPAELPAVLGIRHQHLLRHKDPLRGVVRETQGNSKRIGGTVASVTNPSSGFICAALEEALA